MPCHSVHTSHTSLQGQEASSPNTSSAVAWSQKTPRCLSTNRNAPSPRANMSSSKRVGFSVLPGTGASAAKKQKAGSGFVVCPVCERFVPRVTISFHVEECLLQQQAEPKHRLQQGKEGLGEALVPAVGILRSKEKQHASGHAVATEQALLHRRSEAAATGISPVTAAAAPLYSVANAPAATPMAAPTAAAAAEATEVAEPTPTTHTARTGVTSTALDVSDAAQEQQRHQLQPQPRRQQLLIPHQQSKRLFVLPDGTRCLGTPHRELRGQWMFEDFVSEAEEQELLQHIDAAAPAWQAQHFNGSYLTKAWGVLKDFQACVVRHPKHQMPAFLTRLAERMRGLPTLAAFIPNEANAMQYFKDRHWLDAHADHRTLSTELVVNLSLGGCATMTFARTRSPAHEVRALMPRRSLQVMSGDARYQYTHGIKKQDFRDQRRVSVTFRFSPLTQD